MRKYLVLSAAALLVADGLRAQANTCPPGSSDGTASGAAANAVHDACLQAVDVFQFMAPQLGLALSGGNATLGQGSALGGLGHFSLGVRVNAFRGDLPQVTDFPAPRPNDTSAPQVLPSEKQPVGFPVVDLALGIFKGFPLGVTNVGGIDLLVNAAYVPEFGKEGDDVRIDTDSPLRLGFGGRLGIIQESLVTPGLAVTYIRRDLPTTTITANSDAVDFSLDKVSVKTSAWRVVASKSLIAFGLAVGYGQDHYDQSTTASGTVQIPAPPFGDVTQPFGPIELAQTVTRTNMFADLSINMPFVKVVGEIGQVSGGTFTAPTNTFSDGAPDDKRLYASVGLRLGW